MLLQKLHLLVLVILLTGSAAAQDIPGELPVEPYAISNENAGAEPFDDTQLFEAFNGQEGIARIVDGMLDRNLVDPRISDIFIAADVARSRRMIKEHFCYLLAGPCEYTGRDMASSHRDMGITTRELNAMVENLQAAMTDEGVPFRAQNKFLAKLAPMKPDIVTR